MRDRSSRFVSPASPVGRRARPKTRDSRPPAPIRGMCVRPCARSDACAATCVRRAMQKVTDDTARKAASEEAARKVSEEAARKAAEEAADLRRRVEVTHKDMQKH